MIAPRNGCERTVRVDLKGIHRVRRRLASGAVVEHHYAWRGGPPIWRSGQPNPPGSPGYLEAWQAAQAPARAAGTFRDVILAYQSSADWRRLAPRTRADYARWLDRIDAKFGTAPLDAFNRPAIRRVALAWRDQWSGRQADYAWSVLVRLVGWAQSRAILREHHLTGVDQVYSVDRAELIWTPQDVAAFDAAPDPIRRAMVAATETGLRPGDLVRLARAHIQATPGGRRIQMRTAKRGRLVSIPVTARMAEVIDATPADRLLILVSARGKPWDTEHLSKSVKAFARSAGLDPRLRLYDARGTACTRLLMAGASLGEIALVMGWSMRTAARMIETYAAMDPAASDGVLVKLRGEP